jgi:cytochrome oxidase Cu insertion factor (SCO1/SenC/PrrC family)
MKLRTLALAAPLLLSALAAGQDFKLGSKAGDFTLRDLAGKEVAFADLKGPVTVVTFISTTCPISNAYNDRLNAVYQDYSAKGVKFIFVNANNNEPPAVVEKHAKDVGFAFPVYKDQRNVVADRFGATVTPESYVIDSSGTIRYHGQVDDNRNEARIHTHGLRMALDAVLAGKPVQLQETKAFGCTIKRVRKTT